MNREPVSASADITVSNDPSGSWKPGADRHSSECSAAAIPGSDSVRCDVFRRLVENDDDFLGLIAYSLYKRHKIEWIRNHTLSGFASVAVALALFGLMTLYSSYQENGGLEGRIKQLNSPAQPAVTTVGP